MLIGPADNLKKQFRTGFREGNISQFIQDQQMDPLELFEQPLKPLFFPALHQLSDQIGRRIKANASALGTSGKRQGTDQMGFARSRVSDQQNVFLLVEILPSQNFPNQRLIDRGLGLELIGIDGFNDREVGIFDTPFGARFSRSSNSLSVRRSR